MPNQRSLARLQLLDRELRERAGEYRHIILEGYTDNREKKAQELAQKRAETVRDLLVKKLPGLYVEIIPEGQKTCLHRTKHRTVVSETVACRFISPLKKTSAPPTKLQQPKRKPRTPRTSRLVTVSDRDKLQRLCQRIDGRSYPAYRDLKGTWDLGTFVLVIDHVQGDPFADPSSVRVRVKTVITPDQLDTHTAFLAAEDFLLRRFCTNLESRRRGSGRSGELRCLRPGPEIVERSALRLSPDGVAEMRFVSVFLHAADVCSVSRRVLFSKIFQEPASD